MIITRNIAPFVVYGEDSVLTALQKISDNKSRAVFCLDSHGVVRGSFTDGDFRRWVVEGGDLDLAVSVISVATTEFVSAPDSADQEAIASLLSARISHVPLLDVRGRLTGVALHGQRRVVVGPFTIDDESPTLVIAEIGNNHNGSVEAAKRLVDAAVEAKADCAKFQLRHLDSLYRGSNNAGGEDLGAEYTLDLLTKFSLQPEQLFEVFDYCGSQGILPLCTPFDQQSVAALERYDVAGYKIASADLTNHDLLRTVAATGKAIIASTGMSDESEIEDAVAILRAEGAAFVLLHCNSTYPAPFKDVNLRYLSRLRDLADGPVGYSGHERGYHVAVAAVANGARVIEKHLTIDQSLEGVDHKVSLLPDQFGDMVSAIREVEQSLGVSEERRITQGEMMNRANLAKSIVAAVDLDSGDIIKEESIAIRSPGQGLQPNRRQELIGRTVTRAMRSGDYFFPTDLKDGFDAPRDYSFKRPWGLPVRFHDAEAIKATCRPEHLEFHLSYRDMELEPEALLEPDETMGFAVHSPEMFNGDFLLDLASTDTRIRRRSIAELNAVTDLTRTLRSIYPSEKRPFIVVNVGGFTGAKPLGSSERMERYSLVVEGLSEIDQTDVEIIPQTMPPFPWLRGGQMIHNLFVEPNEIVGFCLETGMRVCLDVSHSKLASNHLGSSFRDFVDIVGPHVAYLHLVDAVGVDGEGLQIGEGEIDWVILADQLQTLAPAAPFIPEIWQGHVDNGAGFWLALDRLDAQF